MTMTHTGPHKARLTLLQGKPAALQAAEQREQTILEAADELMRLGTAIIILANRLAGRQ